MLSYISDILSSIDIVTPQYKSLVYTAIGVTTLSAVALRSSWESIKIIGLTVLTGTAYGIINDMIACRDCIEYFTVGHFYDGLSLTNRPIQSLNPNLNAIVWGMIAYLARLSNCRHCFIYNSPSTTARCYIKNKS